MVKLTIDANDNTPKAVYNWKVYTYASLACWASIMIGYDSAFIGTSMGFASFKREFGLTNKLPAELGTLSANIVSTYQAGCCFGALCGYFVGYYFGRKWGLMAASIIFNIGAVMQVVCSHKTGLGLMYAGRLLAGWGVGVASNLTPVYIAEISPPAIRGRLIGLYELGWQIGAVVGFWINYGITLHVPSSNKQWHIPFAVQLIPGGMLAISAVLLKESPRWLSSKGRQEAAIANLTYLRSLDRDHGYIIEEMNDIETALERDQAAGGAGIMGPLRTLFTNGNLVKRLLIAMSLFAMQNGTGINAINYYSPTVFKSLGITGGNTGLLTTGVFGVVKFLGALVWLLYLVDRFGRKPLLIGGAIGGAFSMYYIGAYIAIAQPTKPENLSTKIGSGGASAIAFFYIWTIFYGPTWNGTPWVFSAEVFPTFVRAATQAFTAASNWLFAFLIARFTPQMFAAMDYGVYLFFATLMVLSIPIVYLIVPETSQIPLERMEELFAPGVPPRKAHAIVMSTPHRSWDDARPQADGTYTPPEKSFDEEKAVESRREYA